MLKLKFSDIIQGTIIEKMNINIKFIYYCTQHNNDHDSIFL